jgi:hypothetical protein
LKKNKNLTIQQICDVQTNRQTDTPKILKVTCRVPECKKVLLKQNYRDHLHDVHPDEDHRDLRVCGERGIFDFLTPARNSHGFGASSEGGSGFPGRGRSMPSEGRQDGEAERSRSRSPIDKLDRNDRGSVEELRRRMEEVEVLTRPQLLGLATTLEETKTALVESVVELNQMLARVVAELKSRRIQWDSLGDIEQKQMENLARIDPDVGVYFLHILFQKMKADEKDENFNMMPETRIYRKIEEISVKVAQEVNISDCNNEGEVALKKLQVIEDNVNMMKEIKKLEKVVVSLKESVGVKDKRDVPTEMVNTELVLLQSSSVQEITEKICEFEYREFKDGGLMVCIICGESFKYSNTLPQDYTGCKVAAQFSNLKSNLKRHLASQKHKKKSSDLEAASLIDEKEESRNKAIGLRIGRLCFHIYKQGRPFSDLPLLIHMSIANGVDLGDINHSQ